MIKKKTKLNCSNCKQPCCEGQVYVRLTMDPVIILPLTKKKISVDGIPLKRLTSRLWRCEWLNKKTGKCKNYEGRPTVCRNWYCKAHEIWKDKKRSKNIPFTLNTSVYGLGFPTYMVKRRIKK